MYDAVALRDNYSDVTIRLDIHRFSPNMQWQLPTAASKKRGHEPVQTPIDQLVRTSRQKVLKEIEEVPNLKRDASKLQGRLAMLSDSRLYIRQKRDLELAIRSISEKITRLESGCHLQEFEQNVMHFVHAYNTNESNVRRRTNSAVLPGERPQAFRVENTTNVQAEVVNEYLTVVDRQQPRIAMARADICPRCDGVVPLKLVAAKAIVTCTQCGYCCSYIDATSSAVSFGDDIEFANFSYKRINHFSEWLANVQGIETYEIPKEVLTQVCDELYRQRVTDPNEITFKRVREVLKVLKQRKQYEHTTKITCTITGRPLPKLSTRTQEMAKLMFRACQEPFTRHAGKIAPNRRNFLSYSYILYQFLVLLGESDEILGAFTLLKGKDKRQRMDELFALICKDLDWEFTPSVVS